MDDGIVVNAKPSKIAITEKVIFVYWDLVSLATIVVDAMTMK